MNDLKADITLGTYCFNSNLTIEGYLSQMIEMEHRKNLIKDTTYNRKKAILKVIQSHPIAQYRIQAVTTAQIEDFLYSITNYSNSVIQKEYALLKRCFEDNIPTLIKVNPMKRIKCPKSNQEKVKVRALTIGEQKKLIDILRNDEVKYKEQFLIMLYTGMRMGEINALTIGDINLNFKRIHIHRSITLDANNKAVLGAEPKTKKSRRTIPLPKAIEPIIVNAINNSNDLLFADNGQPISTQSVNNEFVQLRDKFVDKSVSGKVSVHSLRHTYATRCIEGGMQPKVLQELLGHTDIGITLNTYCDAFDEFKTDDINKAEEYLNRLLS